MTTNIEPDYDVQKEGMLLEKKKRSLEKKTRSLGKNFTTPGKIGSSGPVVLWSCVVSRS